MGAKGNGILAWRWGGLFPTFFLATTLLQLAFYEWTWRWFLSGAPVLTFMILQGEANGTRVLPFAHVWSLFTTVNLAYAIASTSWLLYWVFAALCYLAIFVTCLFQFKIMAAITRKFMRALIKQFHFIDDKIALFDIPALEIDTEVDGLLVFRGITFSLSTLSFLVHGVEVGIKLSDDMELAIQVETVSVSLFRSVEVGDCFANLKGGQYEMTSKKLWKPTTKDHEGALSSSGKPTLSVIPENRPELVRMKSEMTDGKPPEDSSRAAAVKDIKRYGLDNNTAAEEYRQILQHIKDTSTIQQAQRHIEHASKTNQDKTNVADPNDKHALRAAICSQLHSKPSVPHPPRRSVKVTTLQKMSSPRVRQFMHRCPMLLRLLLSPISYFHPVKISSITATASGRWIEALLVPSIFKGYSESDSELQRLKSRISEWVHDANFAVVLGEMIGNAQVPFNPTYSINCQLAFENVLAYQSQPQELSLNQVVRLGGADATVVIPTFLLPHHEHLIPAAPAIDSTKVSDEDVNAPGADSTGSEAKSSLESAEKDEAMMNISVRAHLPAVLDQELLDFAALLVKASKLVEIEEAADDSDSDTNKLSELTGALNQKVKDGLKKALIANDAWLSKQVGKVIRKLESLRGDVGYSGSIPVQLGVYRETGWLKIEGEKLLP